MINKIVFSLLFFGLMFPMICFGQMKSGEYVNDKFLDYVIKTKKTSWRGSDYTSAFVETDKSSQTIIISANYHEAATSPIEYKDNKFTFSDNLFNKVSITLDGFTVNGIENISFIYVDNFGRLLFERFLEGEYVSKGEYYKFKSVPITPDNNSDNRFSGIITGKEFSGNFEYGLDHAEIPYDYIIETNKRYVYKIEYTKQGVNLYKTHGNLAEKVDKKPFLVLKRRK